MSLRTYFTKNENVRNSPLWLRSSEIPFRIKNTTINNTLSIEKEPIMRTIKYTLLIALTIILAFTSFARPTEYSVFVGYNDYDYETRKYKQWALMDALSNMRDEWRCLLSRYGYWWSSPHHFWEDSDLTWSTDAFDSDWADHTCVTIVDARARTDKDPYTNGFYFKIDTHYEWNGKKSISNLWRYGAPVRLGESYGRHKGNCRYLFVLGSNTVAIGPARSSSNGPTYTRPDLFQQSNSNHANPFKIWGPVMTDGVRLVLGYTGDSYSGPSDAEDWKKFKEYHEDGFSIAESFAYTSLDADGRHIPVALVQGTSTTACNNTIYNERFFTSRRPRGNESLWWYKYRFWNREPLSDYNRRFYSSSDLAHEKDVLVDDVKPLNHSNYIYESFDSKKTETEYRERYLDIFGLGQTDPMYERRTEQTIYQLSDSDEARVDHQDGSFCYRNPRVYEGEENTVALTKKECIHIAFSLLVDHSIVTPKEVELDSVISVCQMAASEEEINTGVFNSDPEVIGYIAVFKRKLGELPILSNQVDTIKVEVSVNGEVASLISNYKHGRILTGREVVQPLLATTKEAEESLSWVGTIDDVEAGLLPLEDGDYVPVYKVTTSDAGSTSMPTFTVQYLRQDTLEPVSFRAENAIDGDEIKDDCAEN